ncbi:MAG: hypothetical protein ACRBN8_01640 [Nannocystales bacterium]
MKLWGSVWDGASRAPLRLGLVVIVGLSQATEAFQVNWQAQDPERYPPTGDLSRWLADVVGAPWALLALVCAGLIGVVRDRRPIVGGLWALAWAAVLSEWQTQIFGSPSRNAFFPGAMLFGWTLGQIWAASSRTSASQACRERLSEAGALGCLAAAYVGSALSKLMATGSSWADGAQVRALVLQQQPLADWGWLASVRHALIEEPELAVVVSVATLVIEGGAFLLLFGRRLRVLWGVLLLGLHTAIALINTMPYVGASLLVLLFCMPWRHVPAPADDEPTGTLLPPHVVVLLLCIVVAAWALAPLGWSASLP